MGAFGQPWGGTDATRSRVCVRFDFSFPHLVGQQVCILVHDDLCFACPFFLVLSTCIPAGFPASLPGFHPVVPLLLVPPFPLPPRVCSSLGWCWFCTCVVHLSFPLHVVPVGVDSRRLVPLSVSLSPCPSPTQTGRPHTTTTPPRVRSLHRPSTRGEEDEPRPSLISSSGHVANVPPMVVSMVVAVEATLLRPGW